MGQNCLETFSKITNRTKDDKDSPKPTQKRGKGSGTFSFLMRSVKEESEHKKEELRLNAEQLICKSRKLKIKPYCLFNSNKPTKQCLKISNSKMYYNNSKASKR